MNSPSENGVESSDEESQRDDNVGGIDTTDVQLKNKKSPGSARERRAEKWELENALAKLERAKRDGEEKLCYSQHTWSSRR